MRDNNMNTARLTTEDKKHIAHLLAERSLSNINGLDTKLALERYVGIFNEVLESLDKAE